MADSDGSNRDRSGWCDMDKAIERLKTPHPYPGLNADIGKVLCAHHWIIDPPDGAVSIGRCKKCGAEKRFPNAYPRRTMKQWDHNAYKNRDIEPKPQVDVDYAAIMAKFVPPEFR